MKQGQIVAAGLMATLLSGCADALVSSTAGREATTPPLELKLEANNTSVNLNLGGLTEQQFRERIAQQPAAAALPGPIVQLTLNIINRGEETITFETNPGWYALDLQGPGVAHTSTPAMWCIPPPPVTLAAGKSHSETLNGMSFFQASSSKTLLWTKPGKYLLTARAALRVDGQPFKLQSNSIVFDVKEGSHAASEGEGQELKPVTSNASGYIQLVPE